FGIFKKAGIKAPQRSVSVESEPDLDVTRRDSKSTEKVKKKKISKRVKDGKEEVAVEDAPVDITEIRADEVIPEVAKLLEDKPKDVTSTEIQTQTSVDSSGKKIVKKKKITKKIKDGKEEVTVEEGPVEITELPVDEVIPEFAKVVEDKPEEVTATEVQTHTSVDSTGKKIVKKKKITKRMRDGKEEVTVEDAPIEITEIPADEVIPEVAKLLEDKPEDVTSTEIQTQTSVDSSGKKIVKKKKITKKIKDGKEEVTVEEAPVEITELP
ncbi:uncharacterized protein LOC113473298, partial [Diaphorina citri]|uniref:Uncharacterized protein LOC113473298 n=1 Tax=Diaphorina citri TaxID=121845 RepID=A0A3Q0JKB0_DIACI